MRKRRRMKMSEMKEGGVSDAHLEQKMAAVEAPCLKVEVEGVSHDCVPQNPVGLRRARGCPRD